MSSLDPLILNGLVDVALASNEAPLDQVQDIFAMIIKRTTSLSGKYGLAVLFLFQKALNNV